MVHLFVKIYFLQASSTDILMICIRYRWLSWYILFIFSRVSHGHDHTLRIFSKSKWFKNWVMLSQFWLIYVESLWLIFRKSESVWPRKSESDWLKFNHDSVIESSWLKKSIYQSIAQNWVRLTQIRPWLSFWVNWLGNWITSSNANFFESTWLNNWVMVEFKSI